MYGVVKRFFGSGTKPAVALILLAACVLLLAAGCSDRSDGPEEVGGEAPAAPTNPILNQEPVTLTWHGSVVSQDDWERHFVEPIKRQYPNVTLERVQNITLADLIVAQTPPDIIEATTASIPGIYNLGLLHDMTELIRNYNMDMNRFIPVYIDNLKAYASDGQLWGFPFSPSLYGTLYNKGLFDDFGVPYPTDGMTWEETIQLAARVTREVEGVQYRGLDMTGLQQMYSQLSLNPITPEERAVVTTPGWQTVARVWKSIYEIPGNEQGASGNLASFYNPFTQGRLAMLAISAVSIVQRTIPLPELDWDVVTFPTFQEARGMDPYANFKILGASAPSPHKDESFAVLEHLFSDEVQTQWTRSGLFPTLLDDPEIQRAFAADIPTAAGKNMAAFYKNELSQLIFHEYWTSEVSSPFNAAFNRIRSGEADINTALREAEEQMNQAIDALKQR